MTRLTLANGEWLDVRDDIRQRDREDIQRYSVDGISTDKESGDYTYNWDVVKNQTAKIAAWVLNWSVTGEDGKVILWPAGQPFRARTDIVRNLSGRTIDALDECVTAHIKALDEAWEAQKNGTAVGATASASNTPSAS